MQDESSPSLRQTGQARTDFAAIEDELDFIKAKASLMSRVRSSLPLHWRVSSRKAGSTG
jgi:hypothetical protein